MNIIVNQVRKSKIESITFNWAESMKLENGTTVKTFKEAQNIIDMLACEHGSNDGYCKTSFTITWEDGRQHEGRIDVQLKDNMKSNAIGEHVKAFYERCACLKLFCETKEEQENYVRSTMKADPSEFIELLEKYHFEDVTEETVQTETTPEQIDTGISYKLNSDKNGVEIYFASIPSEEIRTQLKVNGFKWSRFAKCWYAKQNENTIALAEQLSSGNIQAIEVTEQTEIELIDFIDVTQFVISEETEKRLIDNSLFGDMRSVGYETKQLQQTLSNLLENTKQVIELTDSTYNKNKLINGFNGFCERYTRELNSYLYSKSVHVPWHISGRGGINISRYNKKMDQLNNKLMKVTKLLENQRKFIKSQKVKLDKIKKVS